MKKKSTRNHRHVYLDDAVWEMLRLYAFKNRTSVSRTIETAARKLVTRKIGRDTDESQSK